MRVIAGSARRLLLKTPRGLSTRPTTDRIKETIFNILQPYLYDACFLDLFSGSGGIGIEALSRGARKAVFVDNDREAASCIKFNLEHTGFTDKADVYECDTLLALRRLDAKKETFDIIFMDPPYESEYIKNVLAFLSTSHLINKDTMIIAEADIKKDFSFANEYGFEVSREKIYKTNKHVFFKLKE